MEAPSSWRVLLLEAGNYTVSTDVQGLVTRVSIVPGRVERWMAMKKWFAQEPYRPNVLLRDAREQQRWTQKVVAGKIGVSVLTVGRWERGETAPSRYACSKLCRLLGNVRKNWDC